MNEPLSREDLDYYHHLLELAYSQNGLVHSAPAIRAVLDRFDRTRLPASSGTTGRIPWQTPAKGYVPRGKQRMGANVTKATGKAQEELEYGIERHEAALGRG